MPAVQLNAGGLWRFQTFVLQVYDLLIGSSHHLQSAPAERTPANAAAAASSSIPSSRASKPRTLTRSPFRCYFRLY
ncbi:hypothetical protein NEOLEDRAFT_1143961 [Neolentinus lepideus HHB14362 ss-1]|uniref:Uncharacterized protein n=1 Tax=Neolentinus lepideus HHB14362 ss-1 TaxID=1314782 RepID=A0A165M6S4_9AGAM|nr:hypothetical protein NEOLEDRAFT_1143961 [Neolentinus lepideus HHB14362 ss-1]